MLLSLCCPSEAKGKEREEGKDKVEEEVIFSDQEDRKAEEKKEGKADPTWWEMKDMKTSKSTGTFLQIHKGTHGTWRTWIL